MAVRRMGIQNTFVKRKLKFEIFADSFHYEGRKDDWVRFFYKRYYLL